MPRTPHKSVVPGVNGQQDIRNCFAVQGDNAEQNRVENDAVGLTRSPLNRAPSASSSLTHSRKGPANGTTPRKRESSSSSHASDSEASEDHDDRKRKCLIEEGSIHRLDMNRLKTLKITKHSQSNNLTHEELLIEQFISNYNEKNQRKKFEHCEPSWEIQLSAEEQGLMSGEVFRPRLYCQKTATSSAILGLHRSDEGSQNIHLAWFFSRCGEIFVYTTNHAWQLVHEYADYDFPTLIAARICSEDGVKRVSEKKLIGDVLESTKTLKGGKTSSVFDPPVLRLYFTADLREDASLKKIKSFASKKAVTSINFGFETVRFLQRLNVYDLPLILDHFSVIARGGRTYRWNTTTRSQGNHPNGGQEQPREEPAHSSSSFSGGQNVSLDSGIGSSIRPGNASLGNSSGRPSSPGSPQGFQDNGGDFVGLQGSQSSQESSQEGEEQQGQASNEEKDTKAYSRNLAKVNKEFQVKLDIELAKMFLAVIKRKNLSIHAFELRCKYPENFPLSSSCELQFDSTRIQLPPRPTVKDVVNAILDNEGPSVEKLRQRNGEEMRTELRGNIKIVWKDPTGKTKSTPLIQCLEGELVYNSHVFWRVMNLWCVPTSTYITEAHQGFVDVLKGSVITDPEQKFLTVRWPNRTQRLSIFRGNDLDIKAHYLKCYDDLGGYIRSNSELFDLMYIHHGRDGPQMYLYFIVSDFNLKTTECCDRIQACQEAIKLASKLSGGSGPLKDFYREHQRRNKGGNFNLPDTFEDFVALLKKAKIVYALSRAQPEVSQTEGPIENLARWPLVRQRANQRRPPTLVEESRLSTIVSRAKLQELLWRDDCPLQVDDMRRLVDREHGEDSPATIISLTAIKIQEELKLAGYLRHEKVTARFLYSTVQDFQTPMFTRNHGLRAKVYEVASHFQSSFKSLRALFEIQHRAAQKLFSTQFMMDEIEEEQEPIEPPHGDNDVMIVDSPVEEEGSEQEPGQGGEDDLGARVNRGMARGPVRELFRRDGPTPGTSSSGSRRSCDEVRGEHVAHPSKRDKMQETGMDYSGGSCDEDEDEGMGTLTGRSSLNVINDDLMDGDEDELHLPSTLPSS